ncbi:hypothetical protein KVR01_001734 [Diaporthe batatas]|uniref:uncharacterized protein n=1 Tax=Diaporthe batatas TaxID=748121 RepID=UPI001D03FEB1|nr:uncharacterized protein KVR01_001734 [Diaporthe batatas]KAG8168985.1 hypothetical protein KVR01_001734 [Diaporthe batatas]
MAAPPPPPKGGLSLYANLLDPKADSQATVSGAPVVYDGGKKDDDAVKKEINQALRFQPIRRPQIPQKKAAKPSFPKSIPPSSTVPDTSRINATNDSRDATATPPPGQGAPPTQRSTLADWAATEEDDYMYGTGATEKRQRGGRKAKKKKQQKQGDNQRQETDWDEIYDPSRPTNVEEYMKSDERIREVREWKAILYAHRRRRRGTSDSDDDSDADERPAMGSQFAPPGDYSFAPPPVSPPRASPAAAAAAAAAATVPDDATGDDAYARRLALSGLGAPPPPPPPEAPSAPPPPQSPPKETATISRGPVRYQAPPQPPAQEQGGDDGGGDMDVDNIDLPPTGLGAGQKSTTDQPMPDVDGAGDTSRSNRPGQKGFAQRLMSKYGWTAGSGLGADSSGIINPLQVKVEKRRKRPDAEGGGYVDPANRARIIGGKTAAAKDPSPASGSAAAEANAGKFGPMSEVIVLQNMLENMPSLQEEVEEGLGQEIGEECGDKYGRVERLHIDVAGRQVFIKFTDQVSALRAVNALEGRVFNGNSIAARFWDTEKFEKGEYA